MIKRIDVHIILHHEQDRSENVKKIVRILNDEPVNIYFIQSESSCIGEWRFRGWSAGEAEFCTFIDDDDLPIPKIFKHIIKCFDDEPAIDGCWTREFVKHVNKATEHRQIYADRRHWKVPHHLVTYRKESILPYLPVIRDCPQTAEHTLSALLLLNDARIKHINEIGYIWNVHEGSTDASRGKPTFHQKTEDIYRELANKILSENKRSHIPEQGWLNPPLPPNGGGTIYIASG